MHIDFGHSDALCTFHDLGSVSPVDALFGCMPAYLNCFHVFSFFSSPIRVLINDILLLIMKLIKEESENYLY